MCLGCLMPRVKVKRLESGGFSPPLYGFPLLPNNSNGQYLNLDLVCTLFYRDELDSGDCQQGLTINVFPVSHACTVGKLFY